MTTEEQKKIELDLRKQIIATHTQTFTELYMNMINFLNKLNLPPQLRAFCYMNFDQGLFWASKSIESIILPVAESTSPAPITPPQDDAA